MISAGRGKARQINQLGGALLIPMAQAENFRRRGSMTANTLYTVSQYLLPIPCRHPVTMRSTSGGVWF